jgi:hypothetical protein
MKKDKSAGDKKHITDGGTCWCNPTIENYQDGEPEVGYATVNLSAGLIRERGLLPWSAQIIGAKWKPETRSILFYLSGRGLPITIEGAMPQCIGPGDEFWK